VAIFTNQATLSYNGTTVNSNIVTGNIVEVLSASKTAVGGTYAKAIPDWMGRQISCYIYSLQDPDGYFYHPQWGKNISISRRARDFTWCLNMLRAFNIKPRYETMLEKAEGKGGSDETLIPEHLRSREAFLAYLDSKNIPERSYNVGNELSAQSRQIIACGLKETCIDYLNALQHPDTGLWHAETNYYGVNGLMKISGFYSAAKLPLPHAMEAAVSAIDAITSDEPMHAVVDLFNTWFAVGNILTNLRTCGGEEGEKLADEIVRTLRDKAPAGIRKSREKIAAFQKPDGSFSYCPTHSCATSQGAPVTLANLNEGDINAATISCTGIIGRALHALEIKTVPHMFGEEERQNCLAILEEMRREAGL